MTYDIVFHLVSIWLQFVVLLQNFVKFSIIFKIFFFSTFQPGSSAQEVEIVFKLHPEMANDPDQKDVVNIMKDNTTRWTKNYIYIACLSVAFKPGGLDLSRSCLNWDSQSRHWQRAGLDSQENLETFKKLVLTNKIFWSRLRYLNLVSMAICKSSTSRSRSRLVKTFEIFSDFCGFLNFFLNLDQEIMDFYKYLDQDFSSQPYLFTFCASKWAKTVGNSNFFS